MKKRFYSGALAMICMVSIVRAEFSTKNVLDPSILDSFYPPIEECSHFWLNADLLCFKPKEKSAVLTNRKTDLFTTANVTRQPTIHPDFEWDFGYRIGFGFLFANHCWDAALNWMHFTADAEQCKSTQGNIQFGMFPIWSLADDILPYDWVSVANMHWKLKLNVVDLDFGRNLNACPFFMRFLIGLRFAQINQHFKVRYGGGIFANGLDLPELDSTFGYDRISMENKFWGIGPRIGFEPELNLGCGFRFYAGAYGTMSIGSFDLDQKETYLKTVRFKCCSNPHKVRWIIDAASGIMWRAFSCCQQYAFTLAFGWEYHMFFQQMELTSDTFCLVSDNRNLSLNGTALSARFDF